MLPCTDGIVKDLVIHLSLSLSLPPRLRAKFKNIEETELAKQKLMEEKQKK